MKLKKMQAGRIYETLKTRSNCNYRLAQQAMDDYKKGKANERKTIKVLSQIYENETVCVKRMTAILNKYYPDCKDANADAVLAYISQYI